MNAMLERTFGLQGRAALVTGAGRGIGAAIACGLAGAGAHVVIHDISEASTWKTRDAITAEGGQASIVAADLSRRGAGEAIVQSAMEKADGVLDIVVINASAQINATLAELDEADLERQLSVNVRSTIELLKTCLPPMVARRWGRVVNIGSINQLRPKSIVTAYAATKAAQHNLIQSLARDHAHDGVLLNTLAPGLVDTDRNADRKLSDPDGWADYVRSLNWMRRAADPQEMVGAALFLASDACSFMAGETVVLSGGY